MVIKWTKYALNDIKEFKNYTQKTSPENYIRGLLTVISKLKDFPKLGFISLYINKKTIRKLIYDEHSIIYYIDGETIIIIAIIHYKQNISSKLAFLKNAIK